MSDELKAQVWRRDEGACQICHKKLIETIMVRELVTPELSALKEVPIFKWEKECWKCHKLAPVVSYDLEADYDYHIGDVEKLDRILLERYPFVKKVFSKTMDLMVIANTCIHCGSLQGNWFIMEDLIEMHSADQDFAKLVDTTLQVEVTYDDLHARDGSEEKPEMTAVQTGVGHVHHKDGNWENNELSNLILVCEDCHHKLHGQWSKGAKPKRSRKQAREGRRLAKESARNKQQADTWRANYYTQKSRITGKQRSTDSHALDGYSVDSRSQEQE